MQSPAVRELSLLQSLLGSDIVVLDDQILRCRVRLAEQLFVEVVIPPTYPSVPPIASTLIHRSTPPGSLTLEETCEAPALWLEECLTKIHAHQLETSDGCCLIQWLAFLRQVHNGEASPIQPPSEDRHSHPHQPETPKTTYQPSRDLLPFTRTLIEQLGTGNTLVCLRSRVEAKATAALSAKVFCDAYPKLRIIYICPADSAPDLANADSFSHPVLKVLDLSGNFHPEALLSSQIIAGTAEAMQRTVGVLGGALDVFSLMIIDECHDALENIALQQLIKQWLEYVATSKSTTQPRLLGLTTVAPPSSPQEPVWTALQMVMDASLVFTPEPLIQNVPSPGDVEPPSKCLQRSSSKILQQLHDEKTTSKHPILRGLIAPPIPEPSLPNKLEAPPSPPNPYANDTVISYTSSLPEPVVDKIVEMVMIAAMDNIPAHILIQRSSLQQDLGIHSKALLVALGLPPFFEHLPDTLLNIIERNEAEKAALGLPADFSPRFCSAIRTGISRIFEGLQPMDISDQIQKTITTMVNAIDMEIGNSSRYGLLLIEPPGIANAVAQFLDKRLQAIAQHKAVGVIADNQPTSWQNISLALPQIFLVVVTSLSSLKQDHQEFPNGLSFVVVFDELSAASQSSPVFANILAATEKLFCLTKSSEPTIDNTKRQSLITDSSQAMLVEHKSVSQVIVDASHLPNSNSPPPAWMTIVSPAESRSTSVVDTQPFADESLIPRIITTNSHGKELAGAIRKDVPTPAAPPISGSRSSLGFTASPSTLSVTTSTLMPASSTAVSSFGFRRIPSLSSGAGTLSMAPSMMTESVLPGTDSRLRRHSSIFSGVSSAASGSTFCMSDLFSAQSSEFMAADRSPKMPAACVIPSSLPSLLVPPVEDSAVTPHSAAERFAALARPGSISTTVPVVVAPSETRRLSNTSTVSGSRSGSGVGGTSSVLSPTAVAAAAMVGTRALVVQKLLAGDFKSALQMMMLAKLPGRYPHELLQYTTTECTPRMFNGAPFNRPALRCRQMFHSTVTLQPIGVSFTGTPQSTKKAAEQAAASLACAHLQQQLQLGHDLPGHASSLNATTSATSGHLATSDNNSFNPNASFSSHPSSSSLISPPTSPQLTSAGVGLANLMMGIPSAAAASLLLVDYKAELNRYITALFDFSSEEDKEAGPSDSVDPEANKPSVGPFVRYATVTMNPADLNKPREAESGTTTTAINRPSISDDQDNLDEDDEDEKGVLDAMNDMMALSLSFLNDTDFDGDSSSNSRSPPSVCSGSDNGSPLMLLPPAATQPQQQSPLSQASAGPMGAAPTATGGAVRAKKQPLLYRTTVIVTPLNISFVGEAMDTKKKAQQSAARRALEALAATAASAVTTSITTPITPNSQLTNTVF